MSGITAAPRCSTMLEVQGKPIKAEQSFFILYLGFLGKSQRDNRKKNRKKSFRKAFTALTLFQSRLY